MDFSCYNGIYAHTVQEPGSDAADDRREAGPLEFLSSFGTDMPFLGLESGTILSANEGDFDFSFAPNENTLNESCGDGMNLPTEFDQFINYEPIDGFAVPATPSSIVDEASSPDLSTFFEPSSPEFSSSSQSLSPLPSSSPNLTEALTPLPPVDYTSLVASIRSDLIKPFYAIIQDIGNNAMPSKEAVQNFLITGPGRYFCAFDRCPWHETGWRREDRAIDHVKKVHFQLIHHICACGKVYQWPQDLKKHRLKQHRQAGEPGVTLLACPESGCASTFDKKFNLDRHRRKVHKKGGSRGAATRK